MPVIKPISELRSYNAVLSNVSFGVPVYLTKNGQNKYVLMDIDEYEKNKATIALLSALAEGELSAKNNSSFSIDEAEKWLGLK